MESKDNVAPLPAPKSRGAPSRPKPTKRAYRSESVPVISQGLLDDLKSGMASSGPVMKENMEATQAFDFSNARLTEDIFKNEEKYRRVVAALKDREKHLALAVSYGKHLAEDNELKSGQLETLTVKHKECMSLLEEEASKNADLERLLREVEGKSQELQAENATLKASMAGLATEADLSLSTNETLKLERQSMSMGVEMLRSEVSRLQRERASLTEDRKNNAKLLAAAKSDFNELSRKHESNLKRLKKVQEQQKDVVSMSQELRTLRDQLMQVVHEREQLQDECETYKQRLEAQTLESLNLIKLQRHHRKMSVPTFHQPATPSKDDSQQSGFSPYHHQRGPSGQSDSTKYVTLASDLASQTASPRSSTGHRDTDHSDAEWDQLTGQSARQRRNEATSALNEYLYMTASAIKIKYPSVDITKDDLAQAGQAVPFWDAYEAMQKITIEAETKQVIRQVDYHAQHGSTQSESEETDSSDEKEEERSTVGRLLSNPIGFFNSFTERIVHEISPSTQLKRVGRWTGIYRGEPINE